MQARGFCFNFGAERDCVTFGTPRPRSPGMSGCASGALSKRHAFALMADNGKIRLKPGWKPPCSRKPHRRMNRMIVGIGVDVVDIERFGRQLERTPGLRDRLFVPAERELNTRSLAARFAAKEAVAKVLGAPAGMNWQDCWIGLDHNGPTVQVKGTVLAVAEAKGVKRWHLSVSHDGGIATATVLAEG